MAGFKIQGFDRLLRKVSMLKRDSTKLFKRDEIDEVAQVFKESQQLVRVGETGGLKDSGRITGNKDSTYIRYGGITVRGKMVFYAKIVAAKHGQWVPVNEERLVRRLKRRRKSIVSKFNL